MTSKNLVLGVLTLGLTIAGPASAARDMCQMLKDKGLLNEVELNECRAAQEKEEASFIKNAQDFAKDWIQYKEGTGFVINSSSMAPGDYRNPAPKPRFSFALGNRLQVRYTFLSPDTPAADESSVFRVRRFKTFMNGNAFYPWVKYKIQVNWVGFNEPDTQNNEPDLEDAFIDVAYFPLASFQAGQFKVPFDRQELTSSGAQQFVDRAITNARFTFSRDQGVMLHGMIGEEKAEWFEYSAGVFNGNGRNKGNNDNPEHLGVGRLYWTPMGPFKYSESDTDNTPKPAVAVGAAYAYNPVRSSSSSTANLTTTIPNPADPSMMLTIPTGTRTTAIVSDADIHRLTADVHFKWRGISALADYFFESRDDKLLDVTTTSFNLSGKTTSVTSTQGKPVGVAHTHGFLVQAGYFIIPRTLEIAARYATFNPAGTDNRQQEVRGAINWFIFAHNLKLQTDFGAVNQQIRAAKDRNDFEARTQVQLIF
jgi:phosphate-selective porin OprO/OprP